jgi:lysosomal acid lipase/cholesteryl ester hydrolase
MHCFLLLLSFAVLGGFAATVPVVSNEEALTEALFDSDVDGNYTVEYLIESNGYPVETHQITNSDGYILTIHRIPKGITGKSNGKVAYLQHGILSSSADWVVQGPGKSLGYILADEGYDVWMGNARGNSWSRNHTTLSPDGAEFWQFSWHQIGVVDIPEMIDYVLAHTGVDGVYYAGHSQGSTSYFVMLSSLPEYNSKIKVQTSLAPIAFMNHMTSPLLQIISFWTGALDTLTSLIGMNEFLPNTDFIKFIVGDDVCKEDSITQFLCTNTLFAICGFSRKQMNTTLLPVITKYAPAGSSTKQMLHYAQEIRSAKFRQYDFGMIDNLKKYGSVNPPNYDLKKITAPTFLIYSKNDWLSAEKDVDRLCTGMPTACKGKILMSDFQFNHLDYMYGIDAASLVYNKVISLFARY